MKRTQAPPHFSSLAGRSSEPPISWLMKLALEKRDLISLAVGFTDNETLPLDEVAELAHDTLRRPDSARAALQYGTTLGLPALREQLCGWWRTQDRITPARRGGNLESRISDRDFLITTGSQQLLYLVSEVLCDPGDIVLVEDPTYFVYLGIVEAMGIRALGFDGLQALKQRLQRLKEKRQLARLKMLYLVTYF